VRYLLALVILIGGSAAGILVYRHLTAGPAVVLPVPVRLSVSANGAALSPGGWSNQSSITLAEQTQPKVVAGADIEVRRAHTKFTNVPTFTTSDPSQVACQGCAPPGTVPPPAHIQLADGAYHWQVRLHNKQGISPWAYYRGVIHVDTQAPAPPAITSPTDPQPATTYHRSTMQFQWDGQDVGSGIAGYSYRLDLDPHGVPRQEMRTQSGSVTLTGVNTGTYYFHVRALDHAGNWGATSTFPVHIDVTPPGLAHVRFSTFGFDPLFGTMRMSFGVTKPASNIRVGVYDQNTGRMVRLYRLTSVWQGESKAITWDGKDASGRPVRPGMYAIYIRTLDQYGHTKLTGWRDFAVNYKHIVVSLSQQRLTAYDGTRVFVSSLVTTGNRALPTPTGTFQILGKFHPFTFHSPWPKSSQYYYKPSKTNYAMLFRDGGYFIHDAPWRSAFGPGTNAQLGTPGNNFTGTHGCVNVPTPVAHQLFDWVSDGTVVQVVQ